MVELVVGDTYGELTILKKVSSTSYLCLCSCGALRIFNKNLISEGRVVSCGHYRRIPPKYKKNDNKGLWTNPIGHKFGSLTVKCRAYGSGFTYWVCKCDCGNELVVKRSDLMNGVVTSCGKCKE